MKDSLENEKEDALYHFTKSETAIFKILPKLCLRFNDFDKTNDPREYLDLGFGAINAEFDRNRYFHDYEKSKTEFNRLLKSDCKVLSCCQDYFAENQWWDGYMLPRMWAQYGENHKGVCLKVDRKKFLEENKVMWENQLFFAKPIAYTNQYQYPFVNHPELKADQAGYVENFIRANHEFIFFQKNRDWSTEHEFRIIHFSKWESFWSIKDSLLEIIVGIDFDQDKFNVLEKLYGNVLISRATYHSGLIQAINIKRPLKITIDALEN